MTTIETPYRATSRIAGRIARFIPAIHALVRQVADAISNGLAPAPDWHRLDDRLQRDIGASPLDAEIAQIHARLGVSDPHNLDAIATGGLSSRQFMRMVNSDRSGHSLTKN